MHAGNNCTCIREIVVFSIQYGAILECPIGYHGTDCSTRCIYPTYGEDCQSGCLCSNETCHFSLGCLPNTGTVTEYQELSMPHTQFID